MSKEDLISLFLAHMPPASANPTPFPPSSAAAAAATGAAGPEAPRRVLLDGHTLTPEVLVAIGQDPTIAVDLSPQAWVRVRKARQIVDNILVRFPQAYPQTL